MTRRCELAHAVLATLPGRRLRRCPQSSHSGRRRPAEDEAFPRVTGAATAGAASVVRLLAEAILPPAVVLVLTVRETAAARGRNRCAAAEGFPCQCCRLKQQQSGTTRHPTKGVVVLTGGRSRRCTDRPISAPVECERSLRLGGQDQNNWLDVMKRLQPRDAKPSLVPSGATKTTQSLLLVYTDLHLHFYT